MSVNVMGTVHALEAARHAGVKKFVYAASSSCYGLAEEIPTTEAAPIRPQYPYALSKYQGEEAVLHWGKVYKLPVVSIRIFNAYGTRSRTTGAYGAVFGVFLRAEAGRQAADRRRRRDAATRFPVRDRRGTGVPACGGVGAASGDLQPRRGQSAVGQPARRAARRAEIVTVPKRPGEPDCTWADISKIRRELGWEPAGHASTTVWRRCSENIDYWRSAPLWDPESIAAATKTWFAMLSEEKPL